MTRTEWYMKYRAARMLIAARNRHDGRMRNADFDDPARKLVWEICYREVECMGECIREAVFYYDRWTYPVAEAKWMMKHNSTCFNRRMPIRESKKKWLDIV